ncbi:hypothetical protein SNEBB_001230, partial [Seison nebaliae]
ANSIIILHSNAHNPTGVDPTREQWEKLVGLFIKRKDLIPFFDSAYLGFSSGSIDEDAFAIRLFGEKLLSVNQHPLLVAMSFAKNFGLYNERIGCFVTCFPKFVGSTDDDRLLRYKSKMTTLIRKVYSNPPNHGARVVSTILNNEEFEIKWRKTVKEMRDQMVANRQMLYAKLLEINPDANWKHLITQTGMFAFTGLTKDQCNELKTQHHIYMLTNGRINVCGIRANNVDRLANALTTVTEKK